MIAPQTPKVTTLAHASKKQQETQHLHVACNDENTGKKNKFLTIKALKSTVIIK